MLYGSFCGSGIAYANIVHPVAHAWGGRVVLPYIDDLPGRATEQGPFLGILFINRVSILREIVIDIWKFPAYHKLGMEIHSNFINRVWKFLRFAIDRQTDIIIWYLVTVLYK